MTPLELFSRTTALCSLVLEHPHKVVDLDGADGGGRTHTLSRVPDFESGASANSATSATVRQYISSGGEVNKFPHARCGVAAAYDSAARYPAFRMFPSHLVWNVRICGQMARRRQKADAVGLAAQLAGLVVLISLFSLPFAGHSPNLASLRCVFRFSSLRVWLASASTGWQPGRSG